MVTVIYYIYHFFFIIFSKIINYFEIKIDNFLNVNWLNNLFFKYNFFHQYSLLPKDEKKFKFKDIYLLNKIFKITNENFSLVDFNSVYYILVKQYYFSLIRKNSKLYKFAYFFINIVLLRNKLNYINKTRTIGSADSLSIFLYDFYKKPYNELKYTNKKNKAHSLIKININQNRKFNYGRILSFYKNFSKIFNELNFIINEINLKNIQIFFKPSSMDKYSSNEISYFNNTIFFLRKNKVFNKGRYSRNRQTYRTGVYWCLYINIVAVLGLYFWFYRFSINFGYTWWFICIFVLAFFLPKIFKFNLYNLYILNTEIKLLQNWLGYIFQFFFHIFKLLNKEIKLNYHKFVVISAKEKTLSKTILFEYFFTPIIRTFIWLRFLFYRLIKLFMNIRMYQFHYKYLDYYIFSSRYKFLISDNFRRPFDCFFFNIN